MYLLQVSSRFSNESQVQDCIRLSFEMLVLVAAMVCSKGLFQFIPTFIFLRIVRINLDRDKLPIQAGKLLET